jgi:predicted neuraminidase
MNKVMLAWVSMLVGMIGCTAGDTRRGDIFIERLFGPELPGPYKHPASITELDNGDLYVAYYCGSDEYGDDTAVWGSRRPAGSTRWTRPAPIADAPWRSEGNPVVWQAPDGLVWLFYVVRYGETWSTSRILAKISRDGARTWSDPILVAMEEGMMVRAHPIVLTTGEYLVPVYHETGHDREWVGTDTCSLFLRYDPKKHTFKPTGRIHSRLGNLQPSVVQLSEKHLVAYCRRGGGFEPRTDGYLVRSESHDGGNTWSPGVDSDFVNPNSAADFIKLRNGHLLLVFNDSMNDRTPLTAAVSMDQGRTWPFKRNLIAGDDAFAYPSAIQTRDGRIHVVFTSHERTVVQHAVFDEEAITGAARQGSADRTRRRWEQGTVGRVDQGAAS